MFCESERLAAHPTTDLVLVRGGHLRPGRGGARIQAKRAARSRARQSGSGLRA